MGTFKKLKKFNLNSLNAQDVDVKTPISAASKFIDLVKTMNKKSDVSNVFLAANMEAFDFEEDKNAIKIVNRLGNLCEWRSKIFQAFAGPKEPGWKGWKQMPPTIFADLGANRSPRNPLVQQLWKPQDEACFNRLCMVNQEHQCDWLRMACSLYIFHFYEAGDFVMCNKHILGDLVERIIHAACMIYVHEMRQGNVHILRI